MNLVKLLADITVDASECCPPYVINIGGGSGSGKTLIAYGLLSLLDHGKEGVVISMDDFYVGKSKMEELDIAGNFDHPKAVDMISLRKFLRMMKMGKKCEKPIYDFDTHERCDSKVERPKEWIFVEGLFALHYKVREYSDVRVFVDCDEATMLRRRAKRDETERGELELSIDEYFFEFVLPMHRKCVLPTRKYANIRWDNSGVSH